MNFYCNICKIKLSCSKSLKRHNESARHKNRIENKANHVCDCGKSFTLLTNLSRHRKTCKFTKDQESEKEQNEDIMSLKSKLEEVTKQHDEDIEVLKEQIKKLQSGGNKNNRCDNNIDTQNNNININMNSFGQENIKYITDSMMEKYIGRVYNSIPTLVDVMHFHPDHPENHNIKMTNHRLQYVKVLDKDKKWVYANKQNTINKLIDKSYTMLETTFEGCRDELSEINQRNFEQFQTNFIAGERETMKRLTDNVQMVLLNGSMR